MTTESIRRHTGLVLGGAGVAAAVVAVALPAAALPPALTVSAPVQVSGDLPPGTGCASADGNGPHAAVDPLHPSHVAVVYSVGGVVASAVASSTNGGASWSRQVLPGLTSCSDGTDGVPGDPMIAIGSGGSVLTTAGWVTNDPSVGFDNKQGDNIRLLANRVDKLGQSFTDPPTEPDPGGPDQRGPISFAPGSNNDVLVAFERVHYVNNPTFDHYAAGYLAGIGGEIRIAHSSTGGKDWDPETTQVVPGKPGSDLATVGLVRSGSAVVLVYAVADTTTIPLWVANQEGLREQLFSITSTDNGKTWSASSAIGTYYAPHGVPQGCCIPDVSVAADGTLYAVWPHLDDTAATTVRYDGVDIATSRDAGQHWTSTGVSNAQLGITAGEVYEPAIAAGAHGGLGLLFYEATGDNNLTARMAVSNDAGLTWTSQALSAPFSWSDVAGGNSDGNSSVGPYQDLVPQGNGYGALVTLGSGSNEDVWWLRCALS